MLTKINQSNNDQLTKQAFPATSLLIHLNIDSFGDNKATLLPNNELLGSNNDSA